MSLLSKWSRRPTLTNRGRPLRANRKAEDDVRDDALIRSGSYQIISPTGIFAFGRGSRQSAGIAWRDVPNIHRPWLCGRIVPLHSIRKTANESYKFVTEISDQGRAAVRPTSVTRHAVKEDRRHALQVPEARRAVHEIVLQSPRSCMLLRLG